MAAKKRQGRRASCSSNEKALMESQQRILEEIATIKEEIRKAYSVQVRETQGYVPTEIEKRMIRDRDIANSVIDRVSESLSKIGVIEPPETSYRPDNTKTFSLLQFFYLVKTCQQSSGMLSSLYPRMEASALTHLSDTLMDYSLKAAQERDIDVRREYRHKVNIIMDKMTRGLNQPIDKGYTTTYQHIRQLLDALVDPGYSRILKEELMPMIPPLSLNPSCYTGPYRLPLPTVPFPKSLLNAYHEKMNTQHQEKEEKEEKSEDKEITQIKDQKDKEKKETVEDLNQKEEKSQSKDQKEKGDDHDSAVVKKEGGDKTNDNNSSAVKEQDSDQKKEEEEDNSAMLKEGDDDEDTRFQDADDDQVVEIKSSILDDQWEDEPSTDLPHTHWESFEQPTRKRRGIRPPRYRRDPSR